MQATQIRDFTKGNITKQLVVFAWPLFLSNLMQIVYNMTDMFVVGKVLGEQGISSVSIGGDVLHFCSCHFGGDRLLLRAGAGLGHHASHLERLHLRGCRPVADRSAESQSTI